MLDRLAWWYYRLLVGTLRLDHTGFPDKFARSVVLTSHCSLLLAILSIRRRGKIHFLVSRSRDGGWIANALERDGHPTIRGSSSRGAIASLRQLLACVRDDGTVAIAIDGPKGPPLMPKDGYLGVLKLPDSHVWLVILHLKERGNGIIRRWFGPYAGLVMFRSWDRFLLPLPFARLTLSCKRIFPFEAADIVASTIANDGHGPDLATRLQSAPSNGRRVQAVVRSQLVKHYGALYGLATMEESSDLQATKEN